MSWERKVLIADAALFLAIGAIWWHHNVSPIDVGVEDFEQETYLAAGKIAVTVACGHWSQTPKVLMKPSIAGDIIPINGQTTRYQTVSLQFGCSDNSDIHNSRIFRG